MKPLLLALLLLPLPALSQSGWWLVLEDVDNDGIRDSCVLTRLDTAREALSLRQETDSLLSKARQEASLREFAYNELWKANKVCVDRSVWLEETNLTLREDLQAQIVLNTQQQQKVASRTKWAWVASLVAALVTGLHLVR